MVTGSGDPASSLATLKVGGTYFEPQSLASPRKKAWTKNELLWGIKKARIAVSSWPVVLGGLGKPAGVLGPRNVPCLLTPLGSYWDFALGPLCVD